MTEQNNSGLKGLYRNLKNSYTTVFKYWLSSEKLNLVFIKLYNNRSTEQPVYYLNAVIKCLTVIQLQAERSRVRFPML